jgi:hypothetical protein
MRPAKTLKALGVDIELYKKGQKQETDFFNQDHFPDASQDLPIDRVKVAMLVADLDYLPLAGSPKGHYRVQVQMGTFRNEGRQWHGTLTGAADVPKDLFDFNGAGGSGAFILRTGSATVVPLFYVYRFVGDSRPKGPVASETVSKLIEWNSTGDVLVVSMRARKE